MSPKGKRRDASQQVVTVPFRAVMLIDLSAIGAAQQFLSASTVQSSRLLAISDAFNLYRFKQFSISTVPPDGPLGYTGIGYVSSLENNGVSTISAAVECNQSVLIWHSTTIPYHMRVSPRLLNGTVPKWFRTRAAAAYDDNLEYQGYLNYFSTSVSSRLVILISGVCEFRDPISTALTLAPVTAEPAFSTKNNSDEETKTTSGFQVVSRPRRRPV